MLTAENISKSFGGVKVLNGLDFAFNSGEMHVVIGPNGAGKTTFVNVMTGVYRNDSGRIFLDGSDISKVPPHRRTRRGIARTFQIPKPFMNLTVKENAMIGSQFAAREGKEEAVSDATKNLTLVGLGDKTNVLAKSLTSAQMKLLDLARAISGKPRYLFVDELGAGLSRTEIDGVVDLMHKINEGGICIIYIGHVMNLVRKLGGTVTAMSEGRVISRGTYQEVVKDPEVLKVYLGEDYV